MEEFIITKPLLKWFCKTLNEILSFFLIEMNWTFILLGSLLSITLSRCDLKHNSFMVSRCSGYPICLDAVVIQYVSMHWLSNMSRCIGYPTCLDAVVIRQARLHVVLSPRVLTTLWENFIIICNIVYNEKWVT